jgi:hypothetical protein
MFHLQAGLDLSTKLRRPPLCTLPHQIMIAIDGIFWVPLHHYPSFFKY